jgi:hypothetical protein
LKIYEPPTSDLPYKTLYWPAANAEAGASLIEVRLNSASPHCDFSLPPPLKSTLVKLVVLLPDGTPAEGARALIGTQMDGMCRVSAPTKAEWRQTYSFLRLTDCNPY